MIARGALPSGASPPGLLGDRGLEWLSAAVMVAWGITLAHPGSTFGSPAFQVFLRYSWMSETAWAAAFALVGGARIAALYVNGRNPRTPHARMAGSLVGALCWGQVSWLLTEGSWVATGTPSTGTGVYALMAMADLVSIFRAAHDARYQYA